MDGYIQQQNRLRQRNKQRNLQYGDGALFPAIISGSHDPVNEVVNIQYHGGERKVGTNHPYLGQNSWIRVAPEAGAVMTAAQRPDSDEPETLAYSSINGADRVAAFNSGVGLYRPLSPGEIEIHSRGDAQSYHSRRPLLEQRAGLIRSWLDQDNLEAGAKAPLHVRRMHLNSTARIQDEERLGVVQRYAPGVTGTSRYQRSWVRANRVPDAILAAQVATVGATNGIVPIPGPWAKEHTITLLTGAQFPPVLLDVRQGDVIDDLGLPVLSSASGLPLRYKGEWFTDTPTGSKFFMGIDNLGNFSVTAPEDALVGGDIRIPQGDLLLTVGRSFSTTCTLGDFSVATTQGSMDLNVAGDIKAATTTGGMGFFPATTFNVGAGDEPAVLGTVLVSLLSQMIQILASHTHVGNMGGLTPLNPADAASLNALKANPVDNRVILSDYINFSKVPT